MSEINDLLNNETDEFIIDGPMVEPEEVEIIEAEVCPDHVHMLVSIPPKLSVSGFMGYLKEQNH